ncbi:hypothetical protein COK34_25525 [Bacillus thuringiensis]|uniref:Uncharacterized protein n=1 Tax=Bacillus cereus TaxID=1396 RepID=A0A2B2LAC5_BACCE|nr:hypothetical protein CN332_29535 [Bacillus thuringiensis]PFQ39695.1 hypothetical protein COK05_27990 [Bacillus cereus]PFR49980.1 hypothetical protein COK34_25525 [Bacillus thuringiensis]
MNDTVIKESFCSSSSYLILLEQMNVAILSDWKKNKTSFTVIESLNNILEKRTFTNVVVLFLLESLYIYRNNKESTSIPPRMKPTHSEEYLRKSIANTPFR